GGGPAAACRRGQPPARRRPVQPVTTIGANDVRIPQSRPAHLAPRRTPPLAASPPCRASSPVTRRWVPARRDRPSHHTTAIKGSRVSSSDFPPTAPSARQPRVLFVYFTYTQQSLKVAEAMADALRERGCDVRLAGIEFTDPRYAERFTRFPLRHAFLDIFGMLPAQLRGATGEIRIPDEARAGDYDLVCVGSPTWWLKTSVPIRSFLKSEEAGRLLDGKPVAANVVCRGDWSINPKAVKKL